MELSPAQLTARQLNPTIIEASASERNAASAQRALAAGGKNPEELKAKFQEFVSGTFYKTLLAAMRKTVSGKSLVHGGRAEDIFRSRLDQTITDQLATAKGSALSDKLFEQFVRQINGGGGVAGGGVGDARGAASESAGGQDDERIAEPTIGPGGVGP